MTGPIEHRCFRKGCTGLACYGFGLVADTAIWACAEHRTEMQTARDVLTAKDIAAEPRTPPQGSLF